MWDVNNIFLNGPFEPLDREGDDIVAAVEGEIPRDLNGTLYRVGPNPHVEPLDPGLHHWFDGDGMVYAVTLRDGRASCRRRWVRTAGFLSEERAGHALYASFMNGGVPQLPAPGAPPFKNPGNTNVIYFDGRLLVFCEGEIPHELSSDTLDTIGRYDYHGAISGVVTAHFKIDPANGDMLFFGAMGPEITWYRADRRGRLIETFKFPTGVPCFIHDFTVTPDYAIFFINPSLVSMENVMRGEPSTIWDPRVRNRIAVMARSNGVVTWIDQDESFAPTHFLNAFQEDGRIIVDGNRAAAFGNRNRQRDWFDVAKPWRWQIDLRTQTVESTQMADFNAEFPRHDDRLTGRRHRFGYYAATRTGVFCRDWLFDHLAKHDVVTGTTTFQNMGGELTSPGEPLFVQANNGASEDDGWVLSIWWNPASNTSEIVIQHAQDFAGRPVARIKLNQRIPFAVHGNWVAAA